MILVDTSVWIDHLNDRPTPKVHLLRAKIGREPLLVGDLILCEVLQGLRSEREAALVESALRRFELVPIVTPQTAIQAATYYRYLRGLGITVRKTIDLLIGAFCIEHGHRLMHSDRDFDAMEHHLGLRVV
jgi:predicted nucleic acid-binding protein